jgi:hypothetical protein
MAKHQKDDEEPKDDDLEEEYDGGEDELEGDFADGGIEIDDDEVAVEDGESDDDDEDVVRPAAKRRAPTKAVPMIEGVPKTKLEKTDVCADVHAKLLTRLGDQPRVQYSIQTRLSANDLVEHRIFGLGFVVDITSPTRAEVLFKDALRKLVHSR